VVAVIWIDWYTYHLARLRALTRNEDLRGNVLGIELVGGCGEHRGLRFRSDDQSEDRRDLPVVTLLPGVNWSASLQPRLAVEVWRKLSAANASLVLVPGYYTAPAIAAALWARLHGRRSVMMAETTRQDHQRVWWKELSKKWLIRLLFDSAIAGGKPHVRYLRELGIGEGSIRRAYDVVDNEFYRSEAERARAASNRSQLGLPEDYFLFVGRLSPEKNVAGLVASFAEYRAAGGRASLVICGDGPQKAELEARASQAGIAQYVRFAGLKAGRELPPYYAHARCFVLPSTREPWGLVVNEAMASGLPVIVSNRCGCAEDLVEDGANGYTFDPGQPGALTQKLQLLGGMDQRDLAAMAERSREIIARYSPEIWASEVAHLVSQRC
jgi:1,2-diacylglycerol 3-alpha-glucosyltransferase